MCRRKVAYIEVNELSELKNMNLERKEKRKGTG